MDTKELKKLIKSLGPEGKEIISDFLQLTPAAQKIIEKFTCALCRSGDDSRPTKHDGNDPATDQVLADMSIDDAMDEIDN